MGLELRLEPRIELRQSLKLEHRLAPPSRWKFDEPKPDKLVEVVGGRKTIKIPRTELDSYIEAIKRTRGVLAISRPALVLISMRGALPMFRCATELNDGVTLRQFRASRIRTSYFIDDLEGEVTRGLFRAFEDMRPSGRVIDIAFLDTSVTGTKLSWFLPDFMTLLDHVAGRLDTALMLNLIILHHKQEGRFDIKEVEQPGERIRAIRYDIGARSLITEDSPTLVGETYNSARVICNPEAEGLIRAYDAPELADILITGNPNGKAFRFRPKPRQSTADLFIGIVRRFANSGSLEIPVAAT